MTAPTRTHAWGDLIREIDSAASVDPMADPLSVRVDADAWHEVAMHLHRSGAHVWEWLSAADLPEGLVIAVHVRSGEVGDAGVIVTAHAPADGPMSSLADIWLGASWHERETAEMFGITFTTGPSAPLLLAGHDVSDPPLRRRTPLARRVSTPWPGRHEPGESDDATATRTRRRPVLPPGVQQEWVES